MRVRTELTPPPSAESVTTTDRNDTEQTTRRISGRALRLGLVALATLSLLLSGCPADEEGDCEPDERIPCTCENGSSGEQSCNTDQRFGDCSCSVFDPGTDAADSGSAADTTTDDTAAEDSSSDEAIDDLGNDDGASADSASADDLADDTAALSDVAGEDLSTDVNPGDTQAEDVGTDSTGDASDDDDTGPGLCSELPALQCNSRIVEACQPESGEYSEFEVCDRTEWCQDGGCETLPEVYEDACRADETIASCLEEGLVCGGLTAVVLCLHPGVSPEIQAVGEPCYGSRDCSPGLLCTRDGFCSEGAVGDTCRDVMDCNAIAELTCSEAGECAAH